MDAGHGPRRLMRFSATLILMLGLLLMPHWGHAQNSQPSEYQVKAAFIFNFAKFVEWPREAFADTKSPLLIGVLGENPFGADLEQAVRGKMLNQRPITIKECRTMEEARKCHVLFISTSEKSRFAEILKDMAGTNILTVGENENFIKSGGMISFFWEGNKIRFEISDEAAKKARLKIDSKLLGLGRKAAD
jgi:hypothetical protein